VEVCLLNSRELDFSGAHYLWCLYSAQRKTVAKIVAKGELQSIRDGRSNLIPRDAIGEWIEMKVRPGRGRR